MFIDIVLLLGVTVMVISELYIGNKVAKESLMDGNTIIALCILVVSICLLIVELIVIYKVFFMWGVIYEIKRNENTSL